MKIKNLIVPRMMLILLMFGILLIPHQISLASSLHPTGLITLNENIPNLHMVPNLYNSSLSLPASVDLTNQFPSVADQGYLGSCVAFAVGYALKTYQEGLDWSWNIQTINHIFSPAYIYNQIHADNSASGGWRLFQYCSKSITKSGLHYVGRYAL